MKHKDKRNIQSKQIRRANGVSVISRITGMARAVCILMVCSILLAGIPAAQAQAAKAKLSGYDSIKEFSDGLAMVSKKEKYGFIDKKGNVVVKPKYEWAYQFSDGLAVVSQDGKYGFINTKGKVAIKLKYDSASSFSEGLACVSKDGKNSFIDKKGKEIIKLGSGLPVGDFSDGVVAVMNGDSSYKIIDKKGQDNSKKPKI